MWLFLIKTLKSKKFTIRHFKKLTGNRLRRERFPLCYVFGNAAYPIAEWRIITRSRAMSGTRHHTCANAQLHKVHNFYQPPSTLPSDSGFRTWERSDYAANCRMRGITARHCNLSFVLSAGLTLILTLLMKDGIMIIFHRYGEKLSWYYSAHANVDHQRILSFVFSITRSSIYAIDEP